LIARKTDALYSAGSLVVAVFFFTYTVNRRASFFHYILQDTYVSTYVRTYVRMYVRMYVRTYVRPYVHMSICPYVHTGMSIRVQNEGIRKELQNELKEAL
jgi:hypothetical protein